jgi:hypothetical protein
LRIAAAVIGGLGAPLGAFKGFALALDRFFLGLTGTSGFSSFLLL